ncbi:hypothetical protein KP509_31G048800 [Ceratopteris richardii]|nr:hypothetical protein KP509_31G048800 [Ceratopteris richardii]KAH7288902.1 hypothetical protein KP509_31G048800 [Ceratopteris richardii]
MMEEAEEDEEEEEEEEDVENEVAKPRKRIGRPPKVWSSVLLPKEVTSTLGTAKQLGANLQTMNHNFKTTRSHEGEVSDSKASLSDMVGQTVHGVVDGCFDAGFLVSLRMGDSNSLYRGVVFGPGLSIPVSNDTDVAKNVKRRRLKQNQIGADVATGEGASTFSLPAPTSEESPVHVVPHPAVSEPPLHFGGPPVQHAQLSNSAHLLESSHNNPSISSPHPRPFLYNGPMRPNFRTPHSHPDMNVNPFVHPSNLPPRASMPVSSAAQGYNPRQNFGHVMPSSGAPYVYNFAGTQGRPGTPVSQYRDHQTDPQYRGP